MGFFDTVKDKAGALAADTQRAGKVTAAQARLVVLQNDLRRAERELGHAAFALAERGELDHPDLAHAVEKAARDVVGSPRQGGRDLGPARRDAAAGGTGDDRSRRAGRHAGGDRRGSGRRPRDRHLRGAGRGARDGGRGAGSDRRAGRCGDPGQEARDA